MLKLTTTDFDRFVHLLNTFDWYYAHSDDHNVHQEGHRQHLSIVNQSKEHPLLEEAYNAYVANFSFTKIRIVKLAEIRSKV